MAGQKFTGHAFIPPSLFLQSTRVYGLWISCEISMAFKYNVQAIIQISIVYPQECIYGLETVNDLQKSKTFYHYLHFYVCRASLSAGTMYEYLLRFSVQARSKKK